METNNVTDTTNGSDSVSNTTTLPTSPEEHRQEDTVTPLNNHNDVDKSDIDGAGDDKLVNTCKFIETRFVNTLTKVSATTTKSLCDDDKTKVCNKGNIYQTSSNSVGISTANGGCGSVKKPDDNNDVDGNKIDLPTLLLDDDGDLVVSPRWSLADTTKSLFNKIDQQNVKGFFDQLMKCPVSHIDELANARCARTNKYVL